MIKSSWQHLSLAVALTCVPLPAHADEGLWPFDAIPKDKIEKSLGVRPTDEWIESVKKSLVGIDSCSGAFVSTSGLVMTSQGCVERCLETQSLKRSNEAWLGNYCRRRALRRAVPLFDLLYCSRLDRDEAKDFLQAGHAAASAENEMACTEMRVDHLLSSTDVSDRIPGFGDNDAEARRAIRSITDACEKEGPNLKCSIGVQYGGAKATLYKYRRYSDVRLVFAPEAAIAHFGEPVESGTFPRHAFPVAFLRVYDEGQPIRSPNYLPVKHAGAVEGQPVFMAGNAAETTRYASADQLRYEKYQATQQLLILSDLATTLNTVLRHQSTRAMSAIAEEVQEAVDDRRRVYRVIDSDLLRERDSQQRTLRETIKAKVPHRLAEYDRALNDEAKTLSDFENFWRRLNYFEFSDVGELWPIAKTLARYASEQDLPSGERAWGFSDAELPRRRDYVLRALHRDDSLDIESLAFLLRKTRDDLGPASPFTKKVLDGLTPEAMAAKLIKGTRLYDVHYRQQLWDGGKAAIAQSTDPLLVFAKSIDAEGRAARRAADGVWQAFAKNEKTIGHVRFAANAAGEYPDGDWRPRLRYGRIRSYTRTNDAAGVSSVPAFSILAGAYGLATTRKPFVLPERWKGRKESVDLSLPLNFVADTDGVLGWFSSGDHGAPMIDSDGNIVGMAFGTNEYGGGAEYRFDAERTRTVALNSAAILHLLDKIYGASTLLNELRGPIADSR